MFRFLTLLLQARIKTVEVAYKNSRLQRLQLTSALSIGIRSGTVKMGTDESSIFAPAPTKVRTTQHSHFLLNRSIGTRGRGVSLS